MLIAIPTEVKTIQCSECREHFTIWAVTVTPQINGFPSTSTVELEHVNFCPFCGKEQPKK